MRKVSADIKFPVYDVEVLVNDDATDDEIRSALLNHAEYLQECGSGWASIVENLENIPATAEDLENVHNATEDSDEEDD